MIKTTLPVLTLDNIVLFPYGEVRLEFERDQDKALISLATSYYNNHILIVHEDPSGYHAEHQIGVVGFINMKLDMPNNRTRLVIHGLKRVMLTNTRVEDGITISEAVPCTYPKLDELEEAAYARTIIDKIESYIDNNPSMSNSILAEVTGLTDLDKLTDIFSNYLDISYEDKLVYINETNPTVRVNILLKAINQDLKVIELENSINEKVSRSIEEEQKKYILQEKIKAIKDELNDDYDADEEITELKNKINNIHCSKETKSHLLKEVKRLSIAPSSSPEVVIIRSYLDEVLSLPWGIKTVDNKDLKKASDILNKNHYGLKEIKERIIEYLALILKTGNTNSPVICLVGPPGVGKTSLAQSIAEAMNRKYTKISVGGVNDEAEITGHRRAYIGSSAGRIIKGIKKATSINPVFVIDEIDKMTKDIKGDPASSLLEVLDKEQNNKFYDNYIEEDFDLSNVMFITTANYKEQIPPELLDRMEIIELSSYTEYDKLAICKDYIIPKTIKLYELGNNHITFTDEAILKIIRNYTKEAGVRELERIIAQILRKIIKDMLINKENSQYQITDKDIEHYLGIEKFLYNKNKYKYYLGIVNGMSYSIYGGDILKIEATYFHGKGNIFLTGLLGDVFTESTKVALSYIKSNYKTYNIIYDLLENSDIHLHVPEGAIKKDGPSAGIAITTALISVFTGKKIPSNISMTGEMTLNGEILPIGGLKEKIIGAKRAGIKTIYLPKDNKKDLDEIDTYIKDKITFKLCSDFKEVAKDLNLL